jgi:hypothetical protein
VDLKRPPLLGSEKSTRSIKGAAEIPDELGSSHSSNFTKTRQMSEPF